MRRIIFTMVIIAAIGYAAICGAAFWFQRSLIYMPHAAPRHPAATLTLPVDGARVLVTVRPHDGPKALIYFGGNAEDVSYSAESLGAAFPAHAVYLLHYRGYGGSTGRPSEAALFADAIALFDAVRVEHPEITLIGRSLGSGVAVHLASRRPVGRLVLVTPFDSLEGIAASHYPYLPIRWLLRDKYQSWRYAPEVVAPTLLVAAERDEVIPMASTETLVRRFRPGIASLRVIAGAGHNTISQSHEYIPALMGIP